MDDGLKLNTDSGGAERFDSDRDTLPFPCGGVFGLDQSPIEAAENALERMERALRRFRLLAEEEDNAQDPGDGNDDDTPRAA